MHKHFRCDTKQDMNNQFIIRAATPDDVHYAQTIVDEIADSARVRGTGIARRTPEYVAKKITEGKAVIATTKDGKWAGFCYIEVWSHGQFVANSGLIVNPEYRGHGLAKDIKAAIFKLSRKKFPEAKIFGLTTGAAVLKINSELGYKPVIYSELTQDDDFWAGCQTCVNYDILKAKNRSNCICTAMLYNPAWEKNSKPKRTQWTERELDKDLKLFERWIKFKKAIMLKREERKKEKQNGK
ncbi:GNAT family N-acetyltransferase [Roseivirga pacifica]|uniref:GNAT family N-acetyltransferase n=1 Tax=Roseivirga pacifica TaxID=1267423 RepID=UPI003BAC2535